jgi:teichuronic acid biosynthesis glycosyltransferase TuaG
MEKNNFDFTHTDYQIIDKNKKILATRKARNFFKLNDLIYSCDIGLSTVMIRRKLFSRKLKFPKIKNKRRFCFMVKLC